jgi:hypothetical protein
MPWRRQTLGDKLHQLARLSTAHVRAIELLVDLMLRRLRATNPRA